MAKTTLQTVYVAGEPKGAKQCTECGHLKLLEEFSYSIGGIGGRHTYCKPCNRALAKKRKEKRLQDEEEARLKAEEEAKKVAAAAAQKVTKSADVVVTVNEEVVKCKDMPPTVKQLQFIQSIEEQSPYIRFMGRTRAEARRFIQLISAGKEALKTNMLR